MSRISELQRQIQEDRWIIAELNEFKNLLIDKRTNVANDKSSILSTYGDMLNFDIFKESTWTGYLAANASVLNKESIEDVKTDLANVGNYLSEVDKAITAVEDKIQDLYDDIAACEAEIEAILASEQE